MDLYSILLLFVVGAVAGFINVFAGGGSILTLPLLTFLGLDAAVANGTNRLAIVSKNISAVYAFHKEKYSRYKISFKLALCALPGAIAGTFVAINISDDMFEKILGVVIIAVVITMLIPKKHVVYEKKDEAISWKVYLSMFAIGLYGGFMQVGVGFLLMAAIHNLMKENLVYVNVHKVFIILFYNIPSIIIFIITDNINWPMGICLSLGMATGGWWAAKLNVKKGEKLVRYILIIAVCIMSLKLLGIIEI